MGLFKRIFRNKKLRNNGDIHYYPWVGDKYKGNANCRVMALGESHYCANSNDDLPTLTNSIIKDFLNPISEHEPYKNTYTKFTNALAGYKVQKNERREIWDYIMFYNYIQEPMSRPRQSPTHAQFKQSFYAFCEVINMYNPDIVIVWGKRLYKNLPIKGEKESKASIRGISVNYKKCVISGNFFVLIEMTHPSAAYSCKFWHDAITEIIESTIIIPKF